jgi:uncharacterized protein involved in type VI secretion and phage assembly
MRKITGVATGIVKSLNDPKGQGRIELQFPWLSETQRSSWAPVAAALAGKGRGAFFMPEPEDEVLVAFEHGDFDHPFIVGFLWNGVDTPPENTNQNRVIITPGGHKLRFEDTVGDQRILIRSSGGHNVILDDASEKVVVNTTRGHTVTLDDDEINGGVTLETNGGHSISLNDGISGGVSVKTNGGHTIAMDDELGEITISTPLQFSQIVMTDAMVSITGGGVTLLLSSSGIQIF